MIKVAIIEDNITIRKGLAALIDGTKNYQCIHTFRTAEQFIESLSESIPDVALMDIQLPGMSGIECIQRIRPLYPQLIVLILTVYEDNNLIFEALCAGASGYLLKRTPPSQLLEAIQDAFDGGSPMSSVIARKVVTLFQQKNLFTPKTNVPLSDREIEVLRALSEGNCYKTIADNLFISIATVRHHIRNIYKKLQVHSQAAAVSEAIKKGIIDS